jgi:glycine cleavage system T protein (aminomethyltransferase)
MEHAVDVPLKKTPLNARHRASGAKMVPFSGWDMPIEYSSVVDEHMAVRTRAGLFDVSHMGEIEIAGRDALAALQRIACNDASRLGTGQAQYSALLTPQGTFIDDVLVYRLAPEHFLLVVNAANIEKDYSWIAEQIAPLGDVVAVNASSRYALLALQGPAARQVLQPLTGADLEGLAYYSFTHGEVASVRATISRTGYTGEDGFEVFVAPQAADRVWLAILNAGREVDVVPAGLGARDTLRLEASMRLFGSDIDGTTTPLEADLGWIVGWKKDDFTGAAALREQKGLGISRKLAGFEMVERGIARAGYDVWIGQDKVGTVTSGTQTPFLRKAIGMAYLPFERAAPNTEIDVDIRGRRTPARVVPMPFYKRRS